MDFAMIKDDRTSLVDIVWPAEISMRKNRSSLINEMWKVVPSVVDAPAVAHAIISHSLFSKAIRYQILGRRDQTAMALAEKHKAQAIKGLRDLLDEYQRSPRPELLVQVRGASTQLAACGVISGDVASSHLHYTGVKMTVDLLGGLKLLRPMQSEALVFSVVASAWFSRNRPVFDSKEWDPGAWAECRLTMRELVDPTPLPKTQKTSALTPHAISPRVRDIISDFRELVDVEEIKYDLASSKSEAAEQVFRWFSLRKLALRARNLQLWCDLKDDIAKPAICERSVPTFGPLLLVLTGLRHDRMSRGTEL